MYGVELFCSDLFKFKNYSMQHMLGEVV